MQRVTISVSDEFAAELEAFMARHGYDNRSEALRDLARAGLGQTAVADGAADSGHCYATVAYVYDHHTRDIPRRLTEAYHGRHDLTVASMHVHLDHDHCLEVAVLQGHTGEVRDFAQAIIAERGVRHGHVSYVPVDVGAAPHSHGHGAPHAHGHAGLKAEKLRKSSKNSAKIRISVNRRRKGALSLIALNSLTNQQKLY
ncbi:nickel-responsive transcriptional regulator NikR [Nitrospirillum amazonense]|uniref:nickel-responsive transcriptional regulator NikR n=1 Tax=Nitrospirillum amazonense TaxID=28077 RepID=UPI002DD44A0D|nr:nickel-responsive transcriptional regulator NikR [Nitrospirillum amazonense]MEC4595230.1 nickel-responsive transcriptional regulator NikR [Nitrospirillum amazonense]